LLAKSLIEDLHAGVVMAMENLVPDLKGKLADGKLTKEEAKSLRDDALTQAKDHMWLPAKALAMFYGQKYVGALVQRIINGKAAAAPAPAPAVPAPSSTPATQ
jgi:hypothetical protein